MVTPERSNKEIIVTDICIRCTNTGKNIKQICYKSISGPQQEQISTYIQFLYSQYGTFICGIQHINTKRKHGKHIVTIYIFQARDGRGNGERIKKKHHNVVNEFESLILLQPFFLYNDYTVFISDPRIWGCDNERGYVSCTCVYIPIFVISVNELKGSSIHYEYKYKIISRLRKSYSYSINFNNILFISHIT